MTSTSCYPNSTNPSDNQVILNRKSLMYTENQTLPFLFMNLNKQIDNNRNMKHTNLFMQGHGQGSVLLDISDCNLDETTILQEIAKQYPTRIGVLTEHAGDVKVVEINFDPNDKAIDAILEKGVCFDNQHIMIPCRAIDNNVDIVYLFLHSLPFIPGKEMAEFMEETLSEYGDVLDFGIFLESTTQTYMCTGYAILDISPKANPYTPLTHRITCRKSNLGRFYATWKGMPDYCQYCHVQDHTTDACPNAETGERIWKDDGTDIKHVKGVSSYLYFLVQKKRREDIFLGVKGQDGIITKFKIKTRTELQKLMGSYCKKNYLPPPNVKFFYKDQLLNGEQTPDDVNMENNDIITIKIQVIR